MLECEDKIQILNKFQSQWQEENDSQPVNRYSFSFFFNDPTHTIHEDFLG